MTTKLPPWGIEPQGTEVCSEENCNRPAVYGTTTIKDTKIYKCRSHNELAELEGQHDRLDGEIELVEDWIEQVENASEGAWSGVGELKHFLILRNRVSDDIPMSYKKQHEVTLRSLYAALDAARKLTEAEIARKEAELNPGF